MFQVKHWKLFHFWPRNGVPLRESEWAFLEKILQKFVQNFQLPSCDWWEKSLLIFLKFSNGQDLQTVIKWGCFVAQQTCHWWVWGALGTSVAFAFCIPTPIWAQVSLSLLCWLIQALWCKQGPANLLCPTRTIPNYASLGGLPLKENLFQG